MANFADAMTVVLYGGKARRKDWNRPSHIEVMEYGGMEFLAMIMKNGTIGPYPPSHCDMLAYDWEEL